jgi:hypothetical protein
MSMITKTVDTFDRAGPRDHPRWLRQAGLALAAWTLTVIGVTAMLEPTTEVIAFGPTGATIRALADSDTRILSIGARSVRLSGTEPGFVRSLYANGAWLVLPSLTGGCISLGAIRR